MRRALLSTVCLWLALPLNAGETPHSTDRPPRTAFSPTEEPGKAAKPAAPPADARRQWRKTGPRGEAPAEKPASPESVSPAADPSPDDQWRRTPADRRWQTWRRLPPSKQIDLWRALDPDERAAYWEGMNVHERATLWPPMTGEERELSWGRTSPEDRAALCDGLPPALKAEWTARLPEGGRVPVRDGADDGKFSPAKPKPGFTPKSSYREDDLE
jgi:hypothetical protein